MTTITNELMYEVLKKIQEDVAAVKSEMADLKHGQIRLREDVHHFAGSSAV